MQTVSMTSRHLIWKLVSESIVSKLPAMIEIIMTLWTNQSKALPERVLVPSTICLRFFFENFWSMFERVEISWKVNKNEPKFSKKSKVRVSHSQFWWFPDAVVECVLVFKYRSSNLTVVRKTPITFNQVPHHPLSHIFPTRHRVCVRWLWPYPLMSVEAWSHPVL